MNKTVYTINRTIGWIFCVKYQFTSKRNVSSAHSLYKWLQSLVVLMTRHIPGLSTPSAARQEILVMSQLRATLLCTAWYKRTEPIAGKLRYFSLTPIYQTEHLTVNVNQNEKDHMQFTLLILSLGLLHCSAQKDCKFMIYANTYFVLQARQLRTV